MLNKLLLGNNLPSVNNFSIAINLILDDVNSVCNMWALSNLIVLSLTDLNPHKNPKRHGNHAVAGDIGVFASLSISASVGYNPEIHNESCKDKQTEKYMQNNFHVVKRSAHHGLNRVHIESDAINKQNNEC